MKGRVKSHSEVLFFLHTISRLEMEECMKKEKKEKKSTDKTKKNEAGKPEKQKKQKKQKKPGRKNRQNMREKEEKVKFSIRLEIVAITMIPLIILTLIVSAFCYNAIQTSMESEVLTGLKDLCYSLSATYDTLDDGAYTLEKDQFMLKGDYQITRDQSMVENLKKQSDVDFNVYFGDTVRATSLTDHKTGEKITGTQASPEVIEKVLNQGEEYGSSSTVVNDWEYYGYYVPLTNPGREMAGMIFAGKPSADINREIRAKTFKIIIVAIIVLIIAAVAVFIIANRLASAVRRAEKLIVALARGELNVSIDKRLLNRKDELGLMTRSLGGLTDKLRDVMQNIKHSTDVLTVAGGELNQFAESTKSTSDEIGRAVGEISAGAITQSGDIDNAMGHVDDMGDVIKQIVAKVETLARTSSNIDRAKEEADEIIQELTDTSERTFDAVNRIADQVRITDDAVSQIGASVSLISSIAEETNLLSLNASIEAARAGEAGKGFAVVASEIQNLADESNRSAASIADVIETLSVESKKTVDAMEAIHDILNEQKSKLLETREKFASVSDGIQSSLSEIQEIRRESENCDKARDNVTDVIRNIASTAEENASATEQTTASMEELNSTMEVLAGKSDELGELGRKLNENLTFFKL